MPSERERLQEDRDRKAHWRKWGAYVSEREWGTVREDYSAHGDAWASTTHDMARSQAYRWGEDGIAGFCDNHQRLCFAFTFWEGKSPILKERLFGLSSQEGNHGEDVKEYYFYLDATPTHSYMRYLYKYPQKPFPYDKLIEENKKRGGRDPEYELLDTGVFSESKYFDLFIEYAKQTSEDIFIRLTAINRAAVAAPLHVLPTLWFRNTWSFGGWPEKPVIKKIPSALEADHYTLGDYFFYFEGAPPELFTDNETKPHQGKDAFHRYLGKGIKEAIKAESMGTKAALHYSLELQPGETKQLYFRLTKEHVTENPLRDAEAVFALRKKEADEFYKSLEPPHLTEELRMIQRQAFAGMIWNEQYYHFVVEDWIKEHLNGKAPRNVEWGHVHSEDILSVPDKWEFPCFFSWDTAFHTLVLAMIDPEFAKKQLVLLAREWYMHPNGELPAYEWSFSDVNPPVHAWATWRVYKIEKRMDGINDRFFLERVFQKLLLNFTWWVNRKDVEGRNVFEGGFLGLDNISIFNRSDQIPEGGSLYQSDATSWMGMYALNMMTMALELAETNPVYEDLASKFFEHFLYISYAINNPTKEGFSLWDEEDGFYYDVLYFPDGRHFPLKVRTIIGLIPLFAVATVENEQLTKFEGFHKRLEWFLHNRNDLCEKISCPSTPGIKDRRIFSILNPERLRKVLVKMLDEEEFLGPFGIRSFSKYHEEHPYQIRLDGRDYNIAYEPGESTAKMFGGNSNWRGPVWIPLNMLIIESLQKYHFYFGDEFRVECPTGSGNWMNLWGVSEEISRRLVTIFTKDKTGERPFYGDAKIFAEDPHWQDLMLFYEYFQGDTGEGLGASHQTGWTGLIAKLIQQLCRYQKDDKPTPDDHSFSV